MPKYEIELTGDGGEFIAGIVKKKFYDVLNDNEISIEDYAQNNLDEDELALIPEKIRPFGPGEWFEISPAIIHRTCCDWRSGEIQVWDEEAKETIYKAPTDGEPEEGPAHGSTDEEDRDKHFSIYDPSGKWEGKVGYTCMRDGNGTFFTGTLETVAPFDPRKLVLIFSNFNERDMITKVVYYPRLDANGYPEGDPIEVEGEYGGSDFDGEQHELRML